MSIMSVERPDGLSVEDTTMSKLKLKSRPDKERRQLPESADRGPFTFDRRRGDRYTFEGQATVHRCDHDPLAYRHRTCSLDLKNLADGGLAAHSDVPLRPDETVTVFFPAHGPEHGIDRIGHVIRCRPVQKGYEVAIKFDLDRAA
jgi:hypothetical protein